MNGNGIEEVEDVTSYLVAYRHYWTDTLRSTVLYGAAEADSSGADRRQWGVNLFQNLTKQLAVGVEVGKFDYERARRRFKLRTTFTASTYFSFRVKRC